MGKVNEGQASASWLAARILHEMQRRGWSLRELSRRSGVPVTTIHAWVCGGHMNPRWDTVARVAVAAGIRTVNL